MHNISWEIYSCNYIINGNLITAVVIKSQLLAKIEKDIKRMLVKCIL